MDRTEHFIRLLHQANPSKLLKYSQQRLLGERGPGVDYNESWGAILVESYHRGDATYQARCKTALVTQLSLAASTFLKLDQDTTGAWQQTLLALHTAAALTWSTGTDPTTDLNGLLSSWLTSLTAPPLPVLPVPRERSHQGTGYPDTDLVAAVLRLVAVLSPWNQDHAQQLWQRCRADQPAVDPALSDSARAERLWWLAQWAMRHNQTAWLAPNMDPLSQTLEQAGWWPGDLTRFFLSIEACIPEGQHRIAQLICQIPYPSKPQRRQQLAAQLHYFGEDQCAIRADYLRQMYQETSAPIARPEGMIIVHQRQATAVIVAKADTHIQRMAYQKLDTYNKEPRSKLRGIYGTPQNSDQRIR